MNEEKSKGEKIKRADEAKYRILLSAMMGTIYEARLRDIEQAMSRAMKAGKLIAVLSTLHEAKRLQDEYMRGLRLLYPEDADVREYDYGPPVRWILAPGDSRGKTTVQLCMTGRVRPLLEIQRIGDHGSAFVLNMKRGGKARLALLSSTTRQRKILNAHIGRMTHEVRKRETRAMASRQRRENAGPREAINDFWTRCKAGGSKD